VSSALTTNHMAVAGIPFLHEGSPGLALPAQITPAWRGTRVLDEPILVHHSVSETEPRGLRRLLEAPIPLGDYYLDDRRDIAIRTQLADLPGYRPQLLRTRRAGFEYSLHYEDPSDSLRLQWGWHRTIFMLALPLRGRGLLVHSTGFLLPDGTGVIAPGVSGAGKSTLAALLRRHASDQVAVLGDDRIAVTVGEPRLRMWGTPWHSSAETVLERDGELGALVFVARGQGATLARLAPGIALRRLLRTVGLPFWDPRATDFALRIIDRMVSDIPAFEFTYDPTPASGQTLVKGLTAALASDT
jgi:hypothetical protein